MATRSIPPPDRVPTDQVDTPAPHVDAQVCNAILAAFDDGTTDICRLDTGSDHAARYIQPSGWQIRQFQQCGRARRERLDDAQNDKSAMKNASSPRFVGLSVRHWPVVERVGVDRSIARNSGPLDQRRRRCPVRYVEGLSVHPAKTSDRLPAFARS